MQNEKHLPFFEMIDAIRSGRCPVCFRVETIIKKYFENLLYEGINDRGFRREFRASRGFCNHHTYQFLRYNDGLAVSLVHRDLIEERIKQLKRGERKRKSSTHGFCIVCRLAKEAEERALSVIMQFWDDDEFRDNFLASEGLCIPHYEALLVKAKAVPLWMKEFQIARFEELSAQLRRYIESCNYSLGERRPVLSRQGSLVWKRAVQTLFGYEGKS